ncbi:MAG: AsmA family protein, partial [Verrucomicrobia bacterium]|nr:AsmA family protein [Verrucomicrobiota bacterium]
MADATSITPAPKKRRGWLRAIAWVFGVLVVLLVVVYFVATSSGFFSSMILPKVSKAMNAQVTVTDASISPFSQVILRGFKVQTTGTEPLVSAAEIRLRYSLMDIIRGNIHVDEVTLASATVTLVENADGSSNLDPILKAQKEKAPETKPTTPPAPSTGKPPQIDLRKFA